MTQILPLKTAETDVIVIKQFDVVVWNLANLFNRQQLILDIGIEFEPAQNVSSLGLLLPYVVRTPKECFDLFDNIPFQGLPRLSSMVEATNTAPAVNRRVVTTAGGDTVDMLRHSVKIVASHSQGRIRRYRGRWSEVGLEFNEQLVAGQTHYVGSRFFVYGPTGMVLWKRSGLAVNGLTLDLKTRPIPPGTGDLQNLIRRKRLVPQRQSFTAIFRSSLDVRTASPEPSVRALDYGTWGKYLDRATDLRDQGALIAYEVQQGPTAGVQSDGGMFLNATREGALWSYGNYLRITLIVASIIAIGIATGLIERAPKSPVSINWRSILRPSYGFSAAGLALLLTLLQRIESARKFLKKSLILIAQWERALFRWVLKFYDRGQ